MLECKLVPNARPPVAAAMDPTTITVSPVLPPTTDNSPPTTPVLAQMDITNIPQSKLHVQAAITNVVSAVSSIPTAPHAQQPASGHSQAPPVSATTATTTTEETLSAKNVYTSASPAQAISTVLLATVVLVTQLI